MSAFPRRRPPLNVKFSPITGLSPLANAPARSSSNLSARHSHRTPPPPVRASAAPARFSAISSSFVRPPSPRWPPRRLSALCIRTLRLSLRATSHTSTQNSLLTYPLQPCWIVTLASLPFHGISHFWMSRSHAEPLFLVVATRLSRTPRRHFKLIVPLHLAAPQRHTTRVPFAENL